MINNHEQLTKLYESMKMCASIREIFKIGKLRRIFGNGSEIVER